VSWRRNLLLFLSIVFALLLLLRLIILPLMGMLSPVFKISSRAGEFVYFLFHYTQVLDTYKEVGRLRSENEFYKRYAASVDNENQRLRSLLDMPAKEKFRYVIADVVLRSPNKDSGIFYLNVGREKGVSEGYGVILPGNIVAGRIIKAGKGESIVAFLNDINFAVAAIDETNREEGIVEGEGKDVVFRFLDKNAEVVKGDVILVSSLSGFFAEGSLIGEVASVKQEGVETIAKINPCIKNMPFYEAIVLAPVNGVDFKVLDDEN